jgi:hypothetical protein
MKKRKDESIILQKLLFPDPAQQIADKCVSMSKLRDKQILEEMRLFSDKISQQIADKCIELDKKYKISSDSMEGYFVYCVFKDQLDLPVAKRLARFEFDKGIDKK